MRANHRLALLLAAITLVGCQKADQTSEPIKVAVVPAKAERVDRLITDENRRTRQPIEVSPAMQGADGDAPWMRNLRAVCEAIESPEIRTTRHTENSGPWKSKIDLTVRDFHIYSPSFKKWTLAAVDKPDKLGKVRGKGPYFGFGLTVQVKNNSDEVLEGDNIYVWADFKSKTGKRTCFADASANRSWNQFAKKGAGAFVKEKEFSEWPLRPGETKRYTVSRSACFNSLFLESKPEEIKIEVYARFRPLGGDHVIVGPMETFERDGALLRGVPTADANAIVQLSGRKGPQPRRALFAAADHVLLTDGKKSAWTPTALLVSSGADRTPKTGTLPAAPEDLSKNYGSLTLKISNWRVVNWQKFAGILKQGHKMLTADVEISIDTSSVQTALEGAVNAAAAAQSAASTEVAAKEAGVAAAQATFDSVKGTDAEGGAKEALAAAKAELKGAKTGLKAADKGLKGAQKALAGGVSSFTKTQAKSVNCGSFKVDVGRKALKLHKVSTLNGKACKPLSGGETVKGTLRFDLERWDMPFVLSWQGPGKVLETHRIASESLATILKD